MFDTYWRFAAKRQDIFLRRLIGEPPPFTDDPILASFRFTNAYRASDRVSQYLISRVIHSGDHSVREVFFRTLLFKIFNRIETWDLLVTALGWPCSREFRPQHYDEILSGAMGEGVRIYSAAYVMPSALGFGSRRKHVNHLHLLHRLLQDRVPERIADARSMQSAFEILRGYHSLGNFLAYQFVTDLNYGPCTDFSEMEFVVPGPGARDGIAKCFVSLGDFEEAEIIRYCAETQEEQFKARGLEFRSLWGRRLQLVDCQNLFCEVDKYARVAHPHARGRSDRKRIKRRYRADPRPLEVWYPPKWGINEAVARTLQRSGND